MRKQKREGALNESRAPFLLFIRPAMRSEELRSEVETDAQREHSDAAGLRFSVVGSFGKGKCEFSRLVAFVVFDGVFAIAIVVEACADMLAEIAAEAKLEGYIGGRLIAKLEIISMFGRSRNSIGRNGQ